MPGSMREVQHAEEEGVEFVWLTAPEAFVGNGKVDGVRAVRVRLGLPDATGRQTPQVIEGSSHLVEGDIVRGASLVVWAIRDGRDAAESMFKYMMTGRAAATRRAA
jgi:glutamate synthase (NADPH/NADH) small chain